MKKLILILTVILLTQTANAGSFYKYLYSSNQYGNEYYSEEFYITYAANVNIVLRGGIPGGEIGAAECHLYKDDESYVGCTWGYNDLPTYITGGEWRIDMYAFGNGAECIASINW